MLHRLRVAIETAAQEQEVRLFARDQPLRFLYSRGGERPKVLGVQIGAQVAQQARVALDNEDDWAAVRREEIVPSVRRFGSDRRRQWLSGQRTRHVCQRQEQQNACPRSGQLCPQPPAVERTDRLRNRQV